MINLNEVNQIVNKYDPLGLLRMGAPKDEYKTESQFITNLLNNSDKTLSSGYYLHTTIYSYFNAQFAGYAGNLLHYQDLANELYSFWQNHD